MLTIGISPGVFYQLPFTIRHKMVSDMLEDNLCLHLTRLEALNQKELTVFQNKYRS